MNRELTEKLWQIILREYKDHVNCPKRSKTSWWERLAKTGIKTHAGDPLPGYVVVAENRLIFDDIHIPIEVAEKMLVLEVIP